MKLVEAQQARQILDRLVGFELSPVVWQKVPGGKSAGRVQSPAVRLLVEREHEIEQFAGSFQFKVTAVFIYDGQEVKAELKQRFGTEADARAFLESLNNAKYIIDDIKTSPSTRNPAAPFTTSTLQQEANAKLGMSSRATMASAQKLYQEGRITYMRTDSVNLSKQAIAAITSSGSTVLNTATPAHSKRNPPARRKPTKQSAQPMSRASRSAATATTKSSTTSSAGARSPAKWHLPR